MNLKQNAQEDDIEKEEELIDYSLDALISKISNLSSKKQNLLIFKLKEQLELNKIAINNDEFLPNKDFVFDFYNLIIKEKEKLLKNTRYSIVCPNFGYLLSLIHKTIKSKQIDDSLTVKDITKMSLKERTAYKNQQFSINSQHNIYESIIDYMKENQVYNVDIYNEIVFNEANQIISNNILNDKKLYLGLVIVRRERLNSLIEKLKESNNLI